jgi:hypothetical protein
MKRLRVKMILPALTEATSPMWRPVKYSLFPPLGLATLAGYLGGDDQVEIQDEHVERLRIDDRPDLVVIQVYITSAYRAYSLADHYRRQGAHAADCTSRRCRTRRPHTPTRSFSVQARIPGRNFSLIFAAAARNGSTGPRRARCRASRRSAAI